VRPFVGSYGASVNPGFTCPDRYLIMGGHILILPGTKVYLNEPECRAQIPFC